MTGQKRQEKAPTQSKGAPLPPRKGKKKPFVDQRPSQTNRPAKVKPLRPAPAKPAPSSEKKLPSPPEKSAPKKEKADPRGKQKPRGKRPEAKPIQPQKPRQPRKAPPSDEWQELLAGQRRAGTAALIGRPNVGKSTLLNAALEHPLAIVSPTPQTTRDALVGVVHLGQIEIALVDTPGLHEATSALSRAMNRSARKAAENADVMVFVTDLPEESTKQLRVHRGDKVLLSGLADDRPTILVINKVDRAADKGIMLPLIEELSRLRSFVAIVPISARRGDGVDLVLREVAKLLPQAEHRFGADDMTDRPTRFFASEYVREQVLLATKQEVPHATAVSIDTFDETPGGFRIAATLHVEREGQKRILIGAGGEMMKRVGTKARERIAELVGVKVHLELFVRVTANWRENPSLLAELGYAEAKGGAKSPSGDES